MLIWFPRSPVLDEVLSGWRTEATNATDPEYEVRITHFFRQSINFRSGLEGGGRGDGRLYSS